MKMFSAQTNGTEWSGAEATPEIDERNIGLPPNEEVPAAWLLTDLQIKHFIEHISEKKDSSGELLIDLQIDHFIDL